jgi:hypothetical protein
MENGMVFDPFSLKSTGYKPKKNIAQMWILEDGFERRKEDESFPFLFILFFPTDNNARKINAQLVTRVSYPPLIIFLHNKQLKRINYRMAGGKGKVYFALAIRNSVGWAASFCPSGHLSKSAI